ncbi:MAG: protein-glutamate O-methyltransferase CheR [Candidatus Velthaea sp.]
MIAEKRPAPAPAGVSPATSDLELQLLLDAVNRTSGYDFREYNPALLKRRVSERVRAEGATTISGLQERVLHEDGALDRFIDAMTFNASSPFREPEFFADFRNNVLPRLRTYPHIRLWVTGCGAADDAYALSMILREADLGHRSRIYATDTCEPAMTRARAGIVNAADMEEYEHLYRQGGGTRAFSDYVQWTRDEAMYRPILRENIVFAQHNLATDGSFNEFHLIVARSVLGLYNQSLAYRAHQVLYESLVRLGYLAVGDREHLRYTPHQRAFDDVENAPGFHRRVR